MAKQHLLLVERDAKTRRLLKVSLEQAHYQVTTARDGADALAKLELATPSLVLSATELPKLDGYALIRRMKENAEWAQIPVIFMVAGESIEDKIRGLELGVEDYLSKPVFVKELLARVQVLLAKRVRRHLSTSTISTRVQGSLSDLPPIDLLESLEGGRQSGVMRITSGDRVGEIVFQDGEIIDARYKRLRGEEVVFRLLCWTEGSFEVEIADNDDERIIESGTRALIEAGMRHAAEYNRLFEQLPHGDTVLKVDEEQLDDRMGDIPGELNGILDLLDQRRSIFDVIDDSPFDDISTLQTLAKLHSEEILRHVDGPVAGRVGLTDVNTIPGPPRTPTPPPEDSLAPAPFDFEEEEFDDQAPTLRPPDVAPKMHPGKRTRLGHHVSRVVPSGEGEEQFDSRRTLTIDQPAIEEEEAPSTPQRGGVVPPEEEPEDLEATFTQGSMSTSAKKRKTTARPVPPSADSAPDSESPVTPGGWRRADEKPASIPPDTSAIDDAFAAAIADEPRSVTRTHPYAGDSEQPEDSELPDDSELPEASSFPPPASEPPELEPEPAPKPEPESEPEPAPEPEPEPAPEPESEPEPEPAPAPEPEPVPSPRPQPEPVAPEPEPISAPAAEPLSDAPASADEQPDAKKVDKGAAKNGAKETADAKAAAKKDDKKKAKDDKKKVKDSERPPPSSGRDKPPSSGRAQSLLSNSGVSDSFFASPVPGEEEEDMPVSIAEPVYLTEEQAERKRRSMKIVGAVVAVLVAATVFILIKGGGKTPPKQPSTTTTAADASTAAAPRTSSFLDVPPSAAPSASGSAAAAGEGGAKGEGGASDGGATGEGGALPDVADPLKEAERMCNVGRFPEAIKMAKAAARKNPEDGTPYFWLATAYESTGKIKEAREAYAKCAELGASPRWNRYCAPYKK